VLTKVFLPGKSDECVVKFEQLLTDLQTLMMQTFADQPVLQLQQRLAFSALWRFLGQQFLIT
jgi:hypothetical protein